MADCIICHEHIEAGDQVVRTDVFDVIEDPEPSQRWGSPIGERLRPVEESPDRQYSHIGCLGASDPEPKRTNARVIDPEEIEPAEDG